MMRLVLFAIAALALTLASGHPNHLAHKHVNRPHVRSQQPSRRDAHVGSLPATKVASDSFSLSLYSVGQVDEMFQFEADVGTPAQRLNLTLVAWDMDFIVSRNISQKKYECLGPETTEAFFDETKSSTFWIDIRNGMGIDGEASPYGQDQQCPQFDLEGKYAADTIKIGNMAMTDAPFLLGQKAWGRPTRDWKAGGFFGIASYNNQEQLVYNFMQQFANPQLSVHIKSLDTKPDLSAVGGTITFGGNDTSNCGSTWTPAKLSIGGSVWFERIPKVSFGDVTLGTQNSAQLNYQTAYILTGSDKTLRKIVNLVGATYDPPSDTYQVDCAKRKTLPDFVVSFQTMDYHVRPTDYVRKLQPTDKLCTLMFSTYKNIYSDGTWWFGTSFLRPYCQLFDYNTEQMYFAKALN